MLGLHSILPRKKFAKRWACQTRGLLAPLGISWRRRCLRLKSLRSIVLNASESLFLSTEDQSLFLLAIILGNGFLLRCGPCCWIKQCLHFDFFIMWCRFLHFNKLPHSFLKIASLATCPRLGHILRKVSLHEVLGEIWAQSRTQAYRLHFNIWLQHLPFELARKRLFHQNLN